MQLEDAARTLAPPGRLARQEKEAIWARIATARRPWWQRRTVRAGTAALAGAVAACALVLVRPHGTPDRADGFTARGSAGIALTLRCSTTREPGDCRIGDHLAFDFGAVLPASHVALFARRADGTVIWYAPADETGATVPLADHAIAGVLDAAAIIDASYVPGPYELFAVLADRPLSRADIRGFERDGRLVPPPGIRVEVRAFTVEPSGVVP